MRIIDQALTGVAGEPLERIRAGRAALPTSTSPDRYRRTVRRLICRCRAIALIVQPRA